MPRPEPLPDSVPVLHALIDERDRLIEVLKGALAAEGAPAIGAPPSVLAELGPAARAIVGALFRVHPRYLTAASLATLAPGWAEDRNPKTVAVHVCHIRKALGFSAIETLAGCGEGPAYRLGPDLRRRMAAPERIAP